jgi:hypothetical protein
MRENHPTKKHLHSRLERRGWRNQHADDVLLKCNSLHSTLLTRLLNGLH